MSEWKDYKIKEIAETYAGGTPSRANPEFFGGDIPFISSSEVNQSYINSTYENITELGLQASSAKWIPPNSVLVALYGATAGQVAKLKISATSNQAVLAVIPHCGFDVDYIYYSLIASKDRLLYLAQGSGQPNLSKETVDKTILTIPISRPEQRKIAHILSTVDAVIEKTEAAIAKYESIKKGMMADLFTRGIDPATGKLRPRYEDAPELYQETELGWVPKDWNIVDWSRTCENVFVGIATSTTKHFVEQGVPLIRNQNILENELNCQDLLHISHEFAQLNRSKFLKTGDILSIRTGYPGLSAVARYEHNGFQTFTTLISRPLPENDSQYLCYVLNSHLGKRQIMNLQGGGAQQNLNVGWLVTKLTPNAPEKHPKTTLRLLTKP